MKILKVLVVFLLLLSCELAFCQESMRAVVYLKNGGVIHGMIIEQIPGKSIKIETRDGNIFVYTFDEIEKIAKERIELTSAPGYRNIPRVGLVSGENNTLFTASDVNGAQLGDDTCLGFGVGYDKYPNAWTLPLFVDFRVDLIGGEASPFLFTDAGYALGWVNGLSGSDWGGIMINAGFGARMALSDMSSVIIEAGYKFQRTREYYYDWSGSNIVLHTREANLDFLSLMVGCIF